MTSAITFCLVINPEEEYIDEQAEITAVEVKERIETYAANFKIRPYNAWRNFDDRDNIERLPAIHIYKRNLLMHTFYLDTDPIQHVDNYMSEYLKKKEKKEKVWLSIIRNFLRFIRIGVSER